MSERELCIERIKLLTDELARIPRTPLHAEKVESRERGLALYQAQLGRIDRMHERFMEHRAELAARNREFGDVLKGR
jgi:hypothetical protein